MFKLLPGKIYVGQDHNSHVGSEAKFQSKEVKAQNWSLGGGGTAWNGNMRIIANNEQFVPYCVIHLAQENKKDGKKLKTKAEYTAESKAGVSDKMFFETRSNERLIPSLLHESLDFEILKFPDLQIF